MAKYIKSYSKYVEKKTHQYTKDGVIDERDMTTVGGFDSTNKGKTYSYQDSTFIFKSDSGIDNKVDLRSVDWVGGLYNLDNVSSVKQRIKSEDTECQYKLNETKLINYAYYGSCVELIRSSLTDIINRFPAEIFIPKKEDGEKRYYMDGKGDVHEFGESEGLSLYEVYNPFGINIYMPYKNEETITNKLKWFANDLYKNFEIITEGKSFEIDGIDVMNNEEVSSCPGKHIHDVNIFYTDYDESGEPYGKSILISVYYGEKLEIVYLCGQNLLNECHIRPKESFYTEFINSLSVFQKQLMNTKTTPKYKAVFEVAAPDEYGYKLKLEEFILPIGRGGYNLLIDNSVYEQYVKRLSYYGEIYDEAFSDNIIRVMTHEAIKNFDWSYTKNGTKVSSILRIMGREFDEIKLNAHGVSTAKNTNYSNGNYTPNYLLSDYCIQDGWVAKNVTPFHVDGYKNIYGTSVWSGGTVTPFSEETVSPYSRERKYHVNQGESELYYGEYFEYEQPSAIRTVTIHDDTFNEFSQAKYTRYSTENNKDFTRDSFLTVFHTNKSYLSSATQSDYVSLPCESGGTYDSKILSDYTSNRVYSVDDVNSYFFKMLRMNSKSLLSKKGTIASIEEMLGLFGFKSKRWASCSKNKSDYNYTIEEYTVSGVTPIIDQFVSGGSYYYIETLNNYKLLPNRDSTNPYSGLMVRYYYKDSNGEFVSEARDDLYGISDRYLFPYYSTEENIDGNIKYQDNGGWMAKNMLFSKGNDYFMMRDRGGRHYKETSRNIGRVDTLSDLISLPKEELMDGSIYKVVNLNIKYAIIEGGLYRIYDDTFNGQQLHFINLEIVNKSLIVGNKSFSNEIINVSDPRYYGDVYRFNPSAEDAKFRVRLYIDYESETPFILNTSETGSDIMISNYKFFINGTYYDVVDKKNFMTNYFVLTNVENCGELSQYGWMQMSVYDYDYHRVANSEDFFSGNNPHRASVKYDGGQKYIDHLDRIFKYVYDNNLIDQRCFGEDSTDLVNMSELGFHITQETSGTWMSSAKVDTKIHSFAKTNEYSGKSVTDDVVNTKYVKISFKIGYHLQKDSKKYLEQVKYIDEVVNEYLSQVIPPCTILEIYFA